MVFKEPNPADGEGLVRFKPLTLRNLLYWTRRTLRDDRTRRRSLQMRDRAAMPPSFATQWCASVRRAVFIVGAARSGTTFLGDAFGQIEGFSYHHEPVATKVATKHVYDCEWSDRFSAFFFRSVFRWLLRANKTSGWRFVQKTPRHSFIVPFLADTFPDARFIHIIRDGRDAALSDSKKPWLTNAGALPVSYEAGGYVNGPYARFWVEPNRRGEFESTSDLHRCIWAWRRYVEAALQGLSAVDTGRTLEVRYEHMIGDPIQCADKISDFLQFDNLAARASLRTQLGKAYNNSIGNWQRATTSDEKQMLANEGGNLLGKLGYE